MFLDKVKMELDKAHRGYSDIRINCLLDLVSVLGPSPKHILLTGQSGHGKDQMIKSLLRLFPSQYFLNFAGEVDPYMGMQITPKTLRYLGRDDDGWDWSHKFFYVPDVQRDVYEGEIIKTIVTEQNVCLVPERVNGRMETQLIKIKGHPLLVFTTTREPQDELVRRYNLYQIKRSEKDSRLIQQYVTNEEDTDSRGNLESIKPVFKDHKIIEKVGMKQIVKDRITRHVKDTGILQYSQGIAYIQKIRDKMMCSAIMNQFDRKIVDGRLMTTDDDFDIVYRLLGTFKLNILGIGHAAFETLKIMYAEYKEKSFEHRDILEIKEFRWNRASLYMYMDKLKEVGAIEIEQIVRGDRDRGYQDVAYYKVTGVGEKILRETEYGSLLV